MSSLKLITIGDPHFRNKYIKVIDQFVQQTLDLIKAISPDFVIVMGDTLDSHEIGSIICQSRAVKWFQAMSKLSKVVVLIGNHDRQNNSDFQTDIHFFNGLKEHKNIWIVDKAMGLDVVVGNAKHRFVFVPYVPPQRFQDALDTLDIKINEKVPTVIFAHQEFKGSKMGAIISEHGDEWPLHYPLVVSGHLHECQSPQENIFYPGTPYQITYSESADKGVYLLTFKEDTLPKNSLTLNGNIPAKPEIKRIKLNLRIKSSITISPEELKTLTLPTDNIDLRIVITGKQESVEAIKYTQRYAEFKKLPHVTILLRPQFEFKPVPKMYQKDYKKVLYDEISADQNLKQIYAELFADLQ